MIPTLGRPEELRLCLEGFTQQTAPRELFEVIVIDDGSAADPTSITSAFAGAINLVLDRREHAGLSAARNTGIERARAPILVLYDDDLRPVPDLVEYCLDFHRHRPAEEDAALLHFSPDPAIAGVPLVRWAFDRLYVFPQTPGPHTWQWFWGGSVTCKKLLFREGGYDPAYRSVEDAEFSLRLSRRMDLRVHFDSRLTGTLTRPLTFAQIYRRQYLMSYFRFILARDHPGMVRFAQPPYDHPEAYVIQDHGTLGALLSAARGLECTLNTRGRKPDARRFRLLCQLWKRAMYHAEATGWIAARDGQPPEPPGLAASLSP